MASFYPDHDVALRVAVLLREHGHMALRLLSKFVLPKLVRCFAESSVVRKDIEGYCATTVGNWGISASNLKEVKIPLPPLAEQHRIVAKMDELMALCDQLEAQLTTTEADSRRLLEAVLHEALHPPPGGQPTVGIGYR